MNSLFRHAAYQKLTAVPQPTRQLIILGDAPLMGGSTGYLAIELGPTSSKVGARLWTLYGKEDDPGSLRAYGRICSNGPEEDALPSDDLSFWINPSSQLTQVAGLGCEWLIPTKTSPRNGLQRVQINTLMLKSEAFTTLGCERLAGRAMPC